MKACLKIYVRKSSMFFIRPLQKMLFCQNISIKKQTFLFNCWEGNRQAHRQGMSMFSSKNKRNFIQSF